MTRIINFPFAWSWKYQTQKIRDDVKWICSPLWPYWLLQCKVKKRRKLKAVIFSLKYRRWSLNLNCFQLIFDSSNSWMVPVYETNGIIFQKHAVVVVCRIRLPFCKQVNIDGTSVSNKACDIEINETLVELHFWKKTVECFLKN